MQKLYNNIIAINDLLLYAGIDHQNHVFERDFDY
jgi:hypothetical protein